MKIINHGEKVDKILVIRFECQMCGCEWLATVNECEVVNSIYIDYKCRCPECGDETRVKMISWHNIPKKCVAEWEQNAEDGCMKEASEGEWIVHYNDIFPVESTEECSICHAEQYINGNDDNYCPNCGVKMK